MLLPAGARFSTPIGTERDVDSPLVGTASTGSRHPDD